MGLGVFVLCCVVLCCVVLCCERFFREPGMNPGRHFDINHQVSSEFLYFSVSFVLID